jgi:hypothetical protein
VGTAPLPAVDGVKTPLPAEDTEGNTEGAPPAPGPATAEGGAGWASNDV